MISSFSDSWPEQVILWPGCSEIREIGMCLAFFSIWREFIHNSVTHADDFAKMNFEMCKYLQNCPSRNENAQISYSVRLFLLPERQIPSRKQHKSQGFESERNKNLGVYFLNRKYLPIYYCPASVMHFNFGTIEWQEMRLLPLLKLDDFASWNQFKIQNVFKTIHYLGIIPSFIL